MEIHLFVFQKDVYSSFLFIKGRISGKGTFCQKSLSLNLKIYSRHLRRTFSVSNIDFATFYVRSIFISLSRSDY